MEVVAGLRVVRGPNWTWGDQDGGEGHVGTVVEVQRADRPAGDSSRPGDRAEGKPTPCVATVQWDCGNRCRYRCGIGDKYDLRVLDSAPAGIRHSNIVCDGCGQEGITGTRWKCTRCFDFDLCSQCYVSGKHSLEHEFDRVDSPRISTRVPTRLGCKKMEGRGTFPGAEVVRGHDWQMQDQESGSSGMTGKVVSIRGKDDDFSRGFAEVQWGETQMKELHRVGYLGKVDLKCTEPSSGCYYYPEHLSVLGAPHSPPNPQNISCGDLVRVELEPEVFKAVQEGHSGWIDSMAEVIGKTGTVYKILDSGDLQVKYDNYSAWTLCPEAVLKVDAPRFRAGDLARVSDDMTLVYDLQQGHGDWGENTVLFLGETGRVMQAVPSGDVLLAIKGRTWLFNPLCLSPYTEGTEPLSSTAEWFKHDTDMGLQMELLSLEKKESSYVVVAATMCAETAILKRYLSKHPEQVNTIHNGKTALQCSATAGNISVMKILLEFNPDLEFEDEQGYKALHLSAASGNKEAVQLLIDAGANVNSTTNDGSSPLMFAASAGHTSVVKLLVKHPKIQLHLQCPDGNTALHSAVLTQKNGSIAILLEAGADPSMVNFSLQTPVHSAAMFGFLPAMEQFIAASPECVNLKAGHYASTPLHIAATYNYCGIVSLLAEQGCDLEARNDLGQTPLHVALLGGRSKIVERLIGYGAKVNTVDADGNGTLHMILSRETMEAPSSDTPQLKKIHEILFGKLQENDSTFFACVTVTLLLIQNGADMHIKNKKGISALQWCPILSTVMSLYAEHAELFNSDSTSYEVSEGGLFGSSGSASLRQSFGHSSGQSHHGHRTTQSSYGGSSASQESYSYSQNPFGGYSRSSGTYGRSPHSSSQHSMYAQSQSCDEDEPKRKYPYQPQPPVITPAPCKPRVLTSTPSYTQSSADYTQFSGSASSTGYTPARPSGSASNTSYTPSQPSGSASRAGNGKKSGDGNLCFLCDNLADVRFSPCGHSSMCSECAPRAKRCPSCRSHVEHFSKVRSSDEKCMKCRKTVSLITRQCGHRFCEDCNTRQIVCSACPELD